SLFGQEDPVGQIIRIKNAPFTIVGLLQRKGSMPWGGDQDDVLLVPYTSAMKRLTGQTTYRFFYVQAETAAQIPDVQNQITELLRQRHRINDEKDDDFMVQTQQEISDRVTATSKIMTVLLGSIASVSLLVGGIGIMNIMLVSVTERTREIGIRLAVGARTGHILLQFLVEATALSLVGGAAGLLLGIAATRLIAYLAAWPTLLSVPSAAGAFLVAGGLGIVFRVFSARREPQPDPSAALRCE